MKKFEKIFLIVAAVGFAMKLLHIPLSGFVLIVSFSLLSIAYFPLGFVVLAKPDRKSQIVVMSILGGLGLSMLVNGLLFKVQHWPLSGFYLVYGSFFGLALMFWVYIKQRTRPELKDYFKGLMERAVILVVLAGALYSLPGRKMLEWHNLHDPERVSLLDSLYHYDLDQQTKEALWVRVQEMDSKERP